MGRYLVLTLFIFVVDGVVGDSSGFQLVSVMEGHSVTLNTGVTKQTRDKMLWYFNNTLIALINGEASTSCLYEGEGGIFRDRLEVDYETGSLMVTDITAEHTGRFEANFIQIRSSGTSQKLNRTSKCDGTKIIQKMSTIDNTIKTFSVSVSASPHKTNEKWFNDVEKEESDMNSVLMVACTAAAVFVVLMMFAVSVVVIYWRRKSSKNDVDKNNHEHLLGIQV